MTFDHDSRARRILAQELGSKAGEVGEKAFGNGSRKRRQCWGEERCVGKRDKLSRSSRADGGVGFGDWTGCRCWSIRDVEVPEAGEGGSLASEENSVVVTDSDSASIKSDSATGVAELADGQ